MRRSVCQRAALLLLLPGAALSGLAFAFYLPADVTAQSSATTETNTSTTTTSTTTGGQTTTADVTLSPQDGDAEATLDFDYTRSPMPVTMNLKATPDLVDQRPLEYVPVDFRSGGRTIQASQVTGAPHVVPGGKTVTLTLSVDPKEAKPGQYKGSVRIEGAKLATKPPVQLTILLDGKTRMHYVLAIGAIVAGVLLGAGVKYLSEVGTKRGTQRRRLRTIDAQLARRQPIDLPRGLVDALEDARQRVAARDPEAETALAQLADDKLGPMLDALDVLKDRRQVLAAQERAISDLHDPSAEPQLAAALATERSWLHDDVRDVWPTASAHAQLRSEHESHTRGFSRFLNVWAAATTEAKRRPPLSDRLRLYGEGEFKKAEEVPAAAPAAEHAVGAEA